MKTLLAAALALVAGEAAAQVCPPRTFWPTDGFVLKIEETKTSRADAVAALDEYMFTLVGKDEERKGIRTDGLAVIKGGDVLYERYARGYGADKKHILWSVTKTLAMLNVGVAAHKGLLSQSDSICRSYVASAELCRATFQHVMEMGSGLDWAEEYEDATYQESSVLAMFYGQGRADMATFVAEHPIIAEPGQRFNYSTGDSTLLMAGLRAVVSRELGDAFPYAHFFDKLGITNVSWERDARGNYMAGSHAYMTLMDMAKVGYFMWSDGCWNGERLIPAGWMSQATAVSQTYRNSDHAEDAWVHGWHVWLNRDVPERNVTRPWKDVPEDAYAAAGHWGQYIYVIPSLDLIVVRTGDDRDGSLSVNEMLKRAIAVGGTP